MNEKEKKKNYPFRAAEKTTLKVREKAEPAKKSINKLPPEKMMISPGLAPIHNKRMV